MVMLDRTKTETRLITGDTNERRCRFAVEIEEKDQNVQSALISGAFPAVVPASTATGNYIVNKDSFNWKGRIFFYKIFFSVLGEVF